MVDFLLKYMARRTLEMVYGVSAQRHASRQAHPERLPWRPGARKNIMRLRVGYELMYHFPQATPVIMMLNIHYTRVSDLERPDHIVITPSVPISGYRDGFGNWCSRILAPAGDMRISTDTVVNDSGLPDQKVGDAVQVPVELLPNDALVFLIASRFCDSDRLLDLAWTHFSHTNPGWARVQAICEFVHERIAFGYEHARVTRSASEAYEEKRGVCRDYAHLARRVLSRLEHTSSLLHGISG
jgi:transglutaminase-like putative cysteine protease